MDKKRRQRGADEAPGSAILRVVGEVDIKKRGTAMRLGGSWNERKNERQVTKMERKGMLKNETISSCSTEGIGIKVERTSEDLGATEEARCRRGKSQGSMGAS